MQAHACRGGCPFLPNEIDSSDRWHVCLSALHEKSYAQSDDFGCGSSKLWNETDLSPAQSSSGLQHHPCVLSVFMTCAFWGRPVHDRQCQYLKYVEWFDSATHARQCSPSSACFCIHSVSVPVAAQVLLLSVFEAAVFANKASEPDTLCNTSCRDRQGV